MREIKFRALEKNLKEIIPVHNIDFEKKMINTESAWRFFDEIVLMQYTGLKDKNGNEIYEGDIVKLLYASHEENEIAQIIYRGDEAAFRIFTNYLLERNLGSLVSSELEVIGNIYQNPELLGESK